jgi:hypothetical protein
MKKLFLIVLVTLSLAAAEKPFPKGIYEEVILADAQSARESAKAMVASLEKGSLDKKVFEKLALDWKRVQALYIAGELDEAYADTPREIDIYHNAKEDITVQLDRIALGNEDVAKAMFKNSFKTINAPEHEYKHPSNNSRTQCIAKSEKDILYRMDTVKRERIENPRTVMHFMKPPQKGYSVQKTVEPITCKITYQKERESIENHHTLITQLDLDILDVHRQKCVHPPRHFPRTHDQRKNQQCLDRKRDHEIGIIKPCARMPPDHRRKCVRKSFKISGEIECANHCRGYKIEPIDPLGGIDKIIPRKVLSHRRHPVSSRSFSTPR